MGEASQGSSDGPQINGPQVMGILNLTPDSFSDGGLYTDPEQAVRHALAMLAEGADILDIGGESTRPGSKSVSPQEQELRVLPVIRRLRERIPVSTPISIDTTSARVARAALDAGASWINDTSAGLDDGEMLPLAAERGAPIVLMHRLGVPATMQEAPSYDDVVAEVCDHLTERAQAALAAGIAADRILLDPGIGFGKLAAHNLALLGALDRIVAIGFQVLLGTSRKRFMGAICGGVEPAALMPATCATTTLGVMSGVRVFRVHDVAGNRQAADIAWAVRNAR
ncbi:dihydropteroate synthase [Thiorhodococcus minor]|uniref:Dihydropteroate synthase n=1 Tax=Thiorhodococcus minor TaxID=57489 RepID=A0A6M0JTP0_9GAMM|nr:dihydropteroate synthase [Thiorhodococcus minor]NEV60906.1 dihydropteroate synthase [Thiorhodococcus minor]